MANKIYAVIYTDDKGRDYVTGMDSEVFAQMTGGTPDAPKVGGRIYDASTDGNVPGLPRGLVTRKVAFRHPTTGLLRYVTALSSDAAIWLSGANTLAIEDSDGVATTYAKDHTRGERQPRKRHKVA